MMNDELVEIDADSMAVTRRFMLKQGAEHGMTGSDAIAMPTAGGGHTITPPKPGDGRLLAHLGPALHRWPHALGGLQQVERPGRDRRAGMDLPPPDSGG